MQSSSELKIISERRVSKIAVIGPGIVGMPMAALLANARIKIGQDEPARVVVVQRKSESSGWKVDAINSGKSIIGGSEPYLDKIVSTVVDEGLLSATHDYNTVKDAEVILVCVQTDKKNFEPDYDPLFEALNGIASALKNKPPENVPLIIIESTLAPSSMQTIVKKFFEKFNLIEGKDILLGNSPNRVMPGRLVERIKKSDKIVAGLNPVTPELIKDIYSSIVTEGRLFKTNSLTAEIEKTTENAYRDVRIAFSAETVRYCDLHDIDYYVLRDEVNALLAQEDEASKNPEEIPSGGMLIPTIGVGGHCLPKDGILLWWRLLESGVTPDESLILNSRKVNNASPDYSIQFAEISFGNLENKRIALLGAAYRADSEDTRNSPSLVLAQKLLDQNCSITIHDPYVHERDKNLKSYGLTKYFTNDLIKAVEDAEFIFICTAHSDYREYKNLIFKTSKSLKGIFDGCHVFSKEDCKNINCCGIGRGSVPPSKEFINYVYKGFRILEQAFANELNDIINFYNKNFVTDEFNLVDFNTVREIAQTCATGCRIAEPGPVDKLPLFNTSYFQLLKAFREPPVVQEQ